MKNAVQKAAVALVSVADLLFRFTVFLSATGFYTRRCFIFNVEIADERVNYGSWDLQLVWITFVLTRAYWCAKGFQNIPA
jgi:hypothetical protein